MYTALSSAKNDIIINIIVQAYYLTNQKNIMLFLLRFFTCLLVSNACLSTAAAAATPDISLGTLTQQLHKITIRNWSPKVHTQLVSACTALDRWPTLNRALEDWLIAAYSTPALKTDAWQAMTGLQQWSLLLARQSNALARITSETRNWLLNDISLSRDFFDTLSVRDSVPNVLSLLQEFHQLHPERFPAYNRLAIAMAVVWDVSRPAQPHQQVPPAAVLQPKCSVSQRFDFWVETNEKGLADYDLTTLEPSQSKFVVDAVCPLDELLWAQSSVHFTRSRLGKVYSSIEYDTERFKNGVYSWPYETYSLKEIKRKGGICIDQAWFATIAGKASGIPTLYFSGRGRQGFHAWFGYMKNDGVWDMDCGRYAIDNYAVGTAIDPQTGMPFSDHQLSFISSSYHNKPAYHAAADNLRMTDIFARHGRMQEALAAADSALLLAPFYLKAWEYKAAILKKQPGSYPALKSHLEAMAGQFKDNADINAAAMAALSSLAREAGDEETALATEKKAIDNTKRERHDLSVALYHTRMREQVERGEWSAACETVRDAVSQFKKEVADTFVLTAEFIMICLQNDHWEEADKALRHFKSRTEYDSSPQMKAKVEEFEDSIRAARKKNKQ